MASFQDFIRYRIDKLVYFESTSDIYEAIAMEKELKDGCGSRR